jgi:sorbitol/mannitol transport system permease protein
VTGHERRGTKLGVGESRAGAIGLGAAAWVVAMLWIFPVAWTLLTSFKTEQDAAAQTLHHGLSLDRYRDVSHSTEGTLSLATAFTNSTVGRAGLDDDRDAARAAGRLRARDPSRAEVARRASSSSSRPSFLPIVASIFPIYVYAQKWNLIGTRQILIILYIAINLPLAIWMLRSFFVEVPRELIEAPRSMAPRSSTSFARS